MAKLHRQQSHRMYIKYCKKHSDRKIVSTSFVTGKTLSPIPTMTVKWNAFLIWLPSQMYLQMQQNLHTQNLLVSCTLCFHDTKEKKKSFLSLCPYPTALTLPAVCQWGLQGAGVQDHSHPMSNCMMLVHDPASVSVDFSQAQVEKKEK